MIKRLKPNASKSERKRWLEKHGDELLLKLIDKGYVVMRTDDVLKLLKKLGSERDPKPNRH